MSPAKRKTQRPGGNENANKEGQETSAVLIPPESHSVIALGREQQDIALTMTDFELDHVEGFEEHARGTPPWTRDPRIAREFHFGIPPASMRTAWLDMKVTYRKRGDLQQRPVWGVVHWHSAPWEGWIREGLIPESGFDQLEGVWYVGGDKTRMLLFSTVAIRQALEKFRAQEQDRRLSAIRRKATMPRGISEGVGAFPQQADFGRHQPVGESAPISEFIDSKKELDAAVDRIAESDEVHAEEIEQHEEELASAE
jgi:hypothetical protein